MIKVLFIGANPQVAEVVRSSIGQRWPDAMVQVRATAVEGLELVEQTSPDVVLLYSSLPDMALAKAIWALRRISDVPLLVLGHQGGEKEIVAALQIGADAYVKLTSDMTELTARILCLLRRAGTIVREDDGKPLLSSSMVLNPATYEVFTGDQWVTLTPTQFRLLDRLLSDASAAAIQESLQNKPKAAPEEYAQLVAKINGRPIKESVEPQQENEHPLPAETQWDHLLSGE